MKAAVLNQQPGELDIEELRIDDPAPGEVLVRTVGAGLCHSDLHFMEGLFRLKVPAVLGHESAGVVEAVGEGVTYVQPGDHVVCCLSIFCGTCRQCLSGVPEPLHEPGGHVAAPGRRAAAVARRRHAGRPVRPPRRLRRDDARPPERRREDHRGHPARQGGAHRLRRAHRLGRRVPHRRRRARQPGVRHRRRRHRPGRHPGGPHRRRRPGDRRRRQRRASWRPPASWVPPTTVNATEVDNVVEAVKELSGGGVDYSFEAIGKKATAEQAFNDARPRRHGHHHRHGARRPAPRDQGHGPAVGEAAAGLDDGLEPVPHRHPPAHGRCTSTAGSTSTRWCRRR